MIEYLKYLLNKVQKFHEGIKNLGKTRLMISEAEKKLINTNKFALKQLVLLIFKSKSSVLVHF